MLKNAEVARRYAKAFFEFVNEKFVLAKEGEQKKAKLLEGIGLFQAFLGEHAFVKHILFSPVFKKEEKASILNVLFKKGALSLSLEVKQFLLFLNEKSRLSFLDDILNILQDMRRKEKAVVRVKIFSLKEALTSDQEEKWKSFFSKNLNKSVEIEHEKKDSLLGGIKMEVGGFILDDSLSYHFNKMRDFLKGKRQR